MGAAAGIMKEGAPALPSASAPGRRRHPQQGGRVRRDREQTTNSDVGWFPLSREVFMSSPNDHEIAWHVLNVEGNVVELEFFVHRRDWDVLEAAARCGGLTIGQVLRQLIRDFLLEPKSPAVREKRLAEGSRSNHA